MSWSADMRWRADTPPAGGLAVVRLPALLCILALGLAACGFTPLHSERAGGPGRADLAAVQIAPIPEREGQLVHQTLAKGMNPAGLRVPIRYRLDIDLNLTTQDLGIRKDDTATRANLRLAASYRLRDSASGEVVHNGSALIVNSYNILESQFATLSSERDALERAAREMGETIRLRVALFLSQSGR